MCELFCVLHASTRVRVCATFRTSLHIMVSHAAKWPPKMELHCALAVRGSSLSRRASPVLAAVANLCEKELRRA